MQKFVKKRFFRIRGFGGGPDAGAGTLRRFFAEGNRNKRTRIAV